MFLVSQVMKFLVLAILLGGAAFQVECLNFSYPAFYKEDREAFIFANHSDIIYEAIQVTSDVRGKDISNLSGKVVHREKFKLWSGKKNTTASFNSTFVLNISNQTSSAGEGLAFILAEDSALPVDSQGQWLGIVNARTNGSSSLTRIVAVEFDTQKSYSDDIDNNHVGVDLNSVYSINQVSLGGLGINLARGFDVPVRVEYDGLSKRLNIYLSNMNDPVISMAGFDLSKHLPEDVYVGFSASTGENTQLNCVKSWNFTSTDIHNDSTSLLWVWILISAVSIILFLGVLAYLIFRICKCFLGGLAYLIFRICKCGGEKVEEESIIQEMYPGIEQELRISTTAPQKYQLKELIHATDNFDMKNKLGEGGFGMVYKGLLYKKEVAVKRISKDSRQGKQEFLAEVKTISGLHHKNLVKLVGWCYESNELLLVYEFMPNGSLDKLIYSDGKESFKDTSTLTWDARHNIIYGVGEALDYLHNGCEKRVLHRDIKASNIMLDSDFNARLGDFGLARTIQLSERTHHSTKEIAGTPGYIAPEFFHTGRASSEIDVYAFGILLLEVACGKKPGNQNEQNRYINGIVEWVWELHRKDKITDAMNVRLNGDYDQDQAECVLLLGLACCNPNPYQRPSMRYVVQVLTGEADPPNVPVEKPAFMWPAMPPLSFSLDLDASLSGGQLTPFSDLSGR